MKNYNEMLNKKEEKITLEILKNVIDLFNNDVKSNIECKLDYATIENCIKALNDEYKKNFVDGFIYALDTDRKATFEKLVNNPNYAKISVKVENNNTYTLKTDGKTLFKFKDLENAYQILHSKETDKNGKPIKNKSVTVFGATIFEDVIKCFIRNLFTENVKVDGLKINVDKVVINGELPFKDCNGECFKSNTNNKLEEQLNIISKFFNIDVKMLKRDITPLKIYAQNVKRNIDNETSIKETDFYKFTDLIFSVVAMRYNNKNVKVFTSDKTELEYTTK